MLARPQSQKRSPTRVAAIHMNSNARLGSGVSRSPSVCLLNYSAAASAGVAAGARRRLRKAASLALARARFASLMWPKPRISSGSAASSTAIGVIGGRQAAEDLVEHRLVLADQPALGAPLRGCGRKCRRACRAAGAASPARGTRSASTGRIRASADARSADRARRKAAAPGGSAARSGPRTGRRRASGNRSSV